MTETPREEPFSAIAIMGAQDFELRGPGIPPVALSFEPDAAWVLGTVLARTELAVSDMSHSGEFRSIVSLPKHGGYDERVRACAHSIVAKLEFTFRALGATLISTEKRAVERTRQSGGSNCYIQEPRLRRDRRADRVITKFLRGFINFISRMLALEYYYVCDSCHPYVFTN